MRKFKIKNRPKRKYIKKQTAPINLSVSKSALISIFPLFFVTLAAFFFVSVIMRSGTQVGPIVSQTVSQNLPHYTVPQITLPVPPKISVTLPNITLPTIDSRPIREYATKTSTSVAGTLSQIFQRTISFLDPRPVFSLMTHTAVYAADKLVAISATTAKILTQTMTLIFQTILHEILLSYRIALQTHEFFISFIVRVGQTITNAFTIAMQTIIKGVMQISQAILHEAQKFGASVQRETNKTIDVMKTPFRIAAYYLEQARPTFNKIGYILKRSAIELENNAVTIFTLPTETMK